MGRKSAITLHGQKIEPSNPEPKTAHGKRKMPLEFLRVR